MNKSNGFLSMAIGLIIVCLAIAVAEYSYFHHEYYPVFSNGRATSHITPNDWKIYSDSQYGFSLKYPPDFSLTEEVGQSVSFHPSLAHYFKTPVTSEVIITIPNPTSTCPSVHPSEPLNYSTQIGQFSKTPYSDVGAGQLYEGADYNYVKGDLCYHITYYIHSANGGAAMFYDNNNPSDQAKITAADEQNTLDKANFVKLVDKIITTFTLNK